MKELEQALAVFLEVLKASEAYQDYEYQKERVKRYAGLPEKINEFRKRRFEVQHYEGDDLFEKIDEFEQEYQNFEDEPIVRDYLAAELEICRRIQEINAAITGVVDIELIQG